MINIRKLAAVDMAWLGTRIILTEYIIGVALPFILGVLSLRAGLLAPILVGWEVALGAWLVAIALNYVPLLVYAILIAKGGTAKKEGGPEIEHAKRYGLQQVIILIPLFVVILTLIQERQARRENLN